MTILFAIADLVIVLLLLLVGGITISNFNSALGLNIVLGLFCFFSAVCHIHLLFLGTLVINKKGFELMRWCSVVSILCWGTILIGVLLLRLVPGSNVMHTQPFFICLTSIIFGYCITAAWYRIVGLGYESESV